VAATRGGIDGDFENVGGPIMDAVFARLNLRGTSRAVRADRRLHDPDSPSGPRSFRRLLMQRIRLQGFIVLDHPDRMGDALAEVSGPMREGKRPAALRPSSRDSISCVPR
jgi:NADPH-dependent curcumin reductase CurA